MLQFDLNGAGQKKNPNKLKSCRHGLLHNWAPENSVVQSVSSRIVLKSLVCFPQPLAAFWLLPPQVHYPLLQPPCFHRLKNDWEEPVPEPLLKGTTQAFCFFFHFTTISHRVIKRRVNGSIHSGSSASEVESWWHHGRCELVAAVLLDHLGFCRAEQVKVLRTRRHHTRLFCLMLIK